MPLHCCRPFVAQSGSQEALYEQLSAAARERWTTLQALIIDEVSMIDSVFLDKVEYVARNARGGERPWGGVQLVFVGDFFQLPPVSLGKFGAKFCFQAQSWAAARVQKVVLREIVRQAADPAFAAILNEIRVGICSPSSLAALHLCHQSVKSRPTDGIEPTKLYCKNTAVDAENLAQLASLPGAEVLMQSTDEWRVQARDLDAQRKVEETMEGKLPATLRLKQGAQVMLLKNMPDNGLVNGSRGVVEGFGTGEAGAVVPIVRFDTGHVLSLARCDMFVGNRDGALVRWQYPLKLAWAITVHKSQGMTLSRAIMGVDDAFAEGQVYVALSRVR
jgi:ATP-dependent DNA helicase PIF1